MKKTVILSILIVIISCSKKNEGIIKFNIGLDIKSSMHNSQCLNLNFILKNNSATPVYIVGLNRYYFGLNIYKLGLDNLDKVDFKRKFIFKKNRDNCSKYQNLNPIDSSELLRDAYNRLFNSLVIKFDLIDENDIQFAKDMSEMFIDGLVLLDPGESHTVWMNIGNLPFGRYEIFYTSEIKEKTYTVGYEMSKWDSISRIQPPSNIGEFKLYSSTIMSDTIFVNHNR